MTVASSPDPACADRMEGFDNLPAELRSALNDGAFPFPVRIALRLLRRGGSAERVAGVLARVDQRPGWKGGRP